MSKRIYVTVSDEVAILIHQYAYDHDIKSEAQAASMLISAGIKSELGMDAEPPPSWGDVSRIERMRQIMKNETP